MIELLLHWLLTAVSLLIVAGLFRGINIKGFGTALLAAIVIGLVNATIGWIFMVITFPLTVITLGLFLLVLNAFMLKVASVFVPGFEVNGVFAAFFGAIVLALVNALLRWAFEHAPIGPPLF